MVKLACPRRSDQASCCSSRLGIVTRTSLVATTGVDRLVKSGGRKEDKEAFELSGGVAYETGEVSSGLSCGATVGDWRGDGAWDWFRDETKGGSVTRGGSSGVLASSRSRSMLLQTLALSMSRATAFGMAMLSVLSKAYRDKAGVGGKGGSLDRSGDFRLGADNDDDRLVEVARDNGGGKSREGSDAAVKARFLRRVDFQRLRVGKREPRRVVRPTRGESVPLRCLVGWSVGSESASLRKPMS